ncbi:hypothetical protein GCM10020295_00300 [Streptomyces cinereospinus]
MQLHTDDGTTGRLLFLGDLAYPTIKKIFDYSESHDRTDRIEWDVLLSRTTAPKRPCTPRARTAKMSSSRTSSTSLRRMPTRTLG